VAPRTSVATAVVGAVETEVLGATYERPSDGELPRTGAPIGMLAVAGAVLVSLGAGLVRRTADRL
jgi:LPXTG-motif cell wall-anchored protein